MQIKISNNQKDIMLIGILVLLLASISWVFWQYELSREEAQKQVALTDAKHFSDSVAQFRNFYASEILPPLRQRNVPITHNFREVEGAIPLPATFAKEFGRFLANKGSSYQVRLYSDLPFSWSKAGGVHDNFEKDAVTFITNNPGQDFWRIEKIDGQSYLRYAVADVLKQSCVACHNAYPGTPKTTWQEGDILGVLEVKRRIYDDSLQESGSSASAFTKMLVLTFIAILLVAFMMQRLRGSLKQTENLLQERTRVNELMNIEVAHRAELSQELSLSEEKIRKVVDSVLDVIIVIDDAGIILECNQAVFTVFGYELEELIGKNVNILMPEPYKSDHDGFLAHYKAGGGKRIIGKTRLMHAQRKNGENFPIDLSVSEISLHGKVQFTGVIRDVTQRIEAENALQEARDKAIESAELKSQFLANMSHEIRTPMNGIIGMTNLLLQQPLTDEQKDLAQTAAKSANSLLTIINDILDFSKIEAGKMEIDSQEVDLLPVVESVIDLVVDHVYEKNLRFGYFIDPKTPSKVLVDETRLRQILLNLVGNAVKFTSEGEVTLLIKFLAEKDSIEFTVEDTGIGISEEAQKNLFSAFSQADGSTTRQFGGTGLGLSISKQLTELMGGQISMQSVEGEGSSFRVILPIASIEAPHCIQAVPSVLPVASLVQPGRFTGRLLAQLSQLNFEVHNFETPTEMIAALSKGELSQCQLIAIDAVSLERYADDVEALQDQLSKVKRPIAWIMTPKQSVYFNQDMLHGLGVIPLIKPIKFSQFSQFLEKIMSAGVQQVEQVYGTKLPVGKELPSQEGIVQEDKTETESDVPFSILLVEDNFVNQKLAIALVKRIGFEVDVANNGQEALDILSNQDYDLVLMDCQMPIKDGYDTTRELRLIEKDDKHTPVIAMTANAMKGDDQLCYAAGMDDYITKPIDAELLESKIQHYVVKKKMKSQGGI